MKTRWSGMCGMSRARFESHLYDKFPERGCLVKVSSTDMSQADNQLVRAN
jgi:hypothetical protein